jgi:hypothetical protein
MALAKPKPLSKPNNTISENSYVDNTDDLTSLTLDELADRFDSIEQQAQLFQGRILLEARNRFESDIAFGEWVTNVGGTLCSTTRQHRTRLMNLARFFDSRELTGISITAAYEISAPINEDVADKIYEYALNKNLPVSEIKAQIQIAKGIQPESNLKAIDVKSQAKQILDDFKKYVMVGVKKVPQQDAILVLQSCIKQIRADIKELENQKKEDTQIVTIQQLETTETSPASEDTGNNS